jgi:hypothetical protein
MRYPEQGILKTALQSPPAMLSFTFPPPAIAVLLLVFVSALFALCVVLGILQYRWIAEVNVTARDRLQEGLQRSLTFSS